MVQLLKQLQQQLLIIMLLNQD